MLYNCYQFSDVKDVKNVITTVLTTFRQCQKNNNNAEDDIFQTSTGEVLPHVPPSHTHTPDTHQQLVSPSSAGHRQPWILSTACQSCFWDAVIARQDGERTLPGRESTPAALVVTPLPALCLGTRVADHSVVVDGDADGTWKQGTNLLRMMGGASMPSSNKPAWLITKWVGTVTRFLLLQFASSVDIQCFFFFS